MPWPKYLHIPSVDEFEHGSFVPDSAYPIFTTQYHPPETLRFKCGTQCCLVGHTAIAFSANGYGASYVDQDPAARAFLKEFCRRAGFPVPPKARVGWWASDVFEDVNTRDMSDVPEDHPGLTPEQAHKLWVETAAHFGYVVDVPAEELGQ